jgi:uncharacterized integral membrane protein
VPIIDHADTLRAHSGLRRTGVPMSYNQVPAGRRDEGRTSRRNRLTGRQIGAIVLGAVILIFAIANTQEATIDFVFGDVTMPLFVVIAVIGLIGFGAGWLVRGRRDKRWS